jgi:hypothetical protein
MEAPVTRKTFRYPATAMPTDIKETPTSAELILKVATALLITFAATLVLVHAQVYFARSLISS